MKKNMIRKIVIGLVLSMILSLFPSGNVYAKNVTDEEVKLIKERNEKYRSILESATGVAVDMYEGEGLPAMRFGLVDYDNDGDVELAANFQDNKYASALISYENNKIYRIVDNKSKGGIYYSASNNNFMIYDGIDIAKKENADQYVMIAIYDWFRPENDFGWYELIRVYLYDENESEDKCLRYRYVVSLEEVENNNVSTEGLEPDVDDGGELLGYYKWVYVSEDELINTINQYMPNKTLIESPYENTAENRAKYLPTDEATIRKMLEEKYKNENQEEENNNTSNQPETEDTNKPNNSETTDNSEVVENNTETAIETIPSKDNSEIFINDIKATLPKDVIFESAKLENKDTISSVEKIVSKVVPEWINASYYELNLLDSSQTKLEQLDGEITINIPLTFDFNIKNKIKVYRVTDKGLSECVASVIDNIVSFKTDHFSTYVILEVSEEMESNINTSLLEDNNNNNGILWIILAVVLILTVAGTFVYMKYFRKKEEK